MCNSWSCRVENLLIWGKIITTRKRSLGQGNVFRSMSVHGGRVSVWCHFLSGFLVPCSFWGYLSLVPCSFLGVSVSGPMFFRRGISVSGLMFLPGGFLSHPMFLLGGPCPGGSGQRPPHIVKSRWYASYWNAFLLWYKIAQRVWSSTNSKDLNIENFTCYKYVFQ